MHHRSIASYLFQNSPVPFHARYAAWCAKAIVQTVHLKILRQWNIKFLQVRFTCSGQHRNTPPMSPLNNLATGRKPPSKKSSRDFAKRKFSGYYLCQCGMLQVAIPSIKTIWCTGLGSSNFATDAKHIQKKLHFSHAYASLFCFCAGSKWPKAGVMSGCKNEQQTMGTNIRPDEAWERSNVPSRSDRSLGRYPRILLSMGHRILTMKLTHRVPVHLSLDQQPFISYGMPAKTNVGSGTQRIYMNMFGFPCPFQTQVSRMGGKKQKKKCATWQSQFWYSPFNFHKFRRFLFVKEMLFSFSLRINFFRLLLVGPRAERIIHARNAANKKRGIAASRIATAKLPDCNVYQFSIVRKCVDPRRQEHWWWICCWWESFVFFPLSDSFIFIFNFHGF